MSRLQAGHHPPSSQARAGRLHERALVRQLHAAGTDTPDAALPLEVVVDDLLRRCGLPQS